MSSEEYLSESSSGSHHTAEIEADLAQMDASSSAPEASTRRGQEASSFGLCSGMDLAAPTRGAWKGSKMKQPEID
jgi:hypothetical protein